MNLVELLQLPWRAACRSLRWLAVVVWVLCFAGALVLGLLTDNPRGWQGALVLFGVGLLFTWAYFLSTMLLLGIDMRLLRAPRVQRRIVLGLGMHGALGVAVPLVVLVAGGLPWLPSLVGLALFGAVGLLFALMPRYVAIFVGMAPSVLSRLWQHWHLPGLLDPRFVLWFGLLLFALLLLIAWRWRLLMLGGAGPVRGWSSPMVLQFRSGNWGAWSQLGDNRQLRQRPAWLLAEASLDGVGPAAPHRTLRVALGGWYLPQTARSYARQLLAMLAAASAPMLVLLLLHGMDAQHPHAADFGVGVMIGTLSSLAVMGGPMICLLSLQWLRRRREHPNGELPLLALLPGLGETDHLKHLLPRVTLGLPLGLHAVLMLGIGSALLLWPGHVVVLLPMLLAQLGAASVTAAAGVDLLGDRLVRTWPLGLLLLVTFVLPMASMLLPVMAAGRQPVAWAAPLLPAIVATWLLFGALMYLLGKRGWRGLMRRPHAFLAG